METQREPRVLLVEDDSLTREALAYILEVEGYYVSTAEDGKQGLEILHRSPRPFVVLLDLGLPIVNGYEFLRSQKQDPEIADIPVFVITAVFEPSVPNATVVLPKPLDLPKLMGLLSAYSHRNQERGH
jgi:CheY-like chemotaxis protein